MWSKVAVVGLLVASGYVVGRFSKLMFAKETALQMPGAQRQMPVEMPAPQPPAEIPADLPPLVGPEPEEEMPERQPVPTKEVKYELGGSYRKKAMSEDELFDEMKRFLTASASFSDSLIQKSHLEIKENIKKNYVFLTEILRNFLVEYSSFLDATFIKSIQDLLKEINKKVEEKVGLIQRYSNSQIESLNETTIPALKARIDTVSKQIKAAIAEKEKVKKQEQQEKLGGLEGLFREEKRQLPPSTKKPTETQESPF